jgi:hypothetical protein
MCLKDLRDEFIYDCECRHLAKGSLRNYKAATRFLLEYLELKQITELEDVRPRHIRDLMKEKQDAGSTSRYINDLLKVWRTWFNYLVNEGYLEERDNPAKKVKCLRQPRTSRGSVMLKKENKMSFLEDVFQTADEIKQSQEKFKSATEASFHQLDVLVRPYLGEAQNETLSDILEGLVASVAEHSFQIGYSSAMQTFAEAAAALEAGSHAQQ